MNLSPRKELRTHPSAKWALQRLVRKTLDTLRPPPKLTVSEWADRNRKLSAESSAEPGQWITANAEYQRGIMDAFCDPAILSVVVMSSAQVGKTEIVNNVIGYHIDQDPSPIFLLQPTLDMAEAYSKDRLAPMVRDTPALQGRVKDARSRDSGNTLLHKTFPGGHITMGGANSPASLASRPIRITLCDEVSRYPSSAGSEGDPVDLMRKRSLRFWNRKHGEFSTPTDGKCRINVSWLESDQRRFFIPCPDCGAPQYLKWDQVRYEKNDPQTAVYVCEACGSQWDDAARWRAIRKGVWQATAEFRGSAGFHIWEAYAPGSMLQSIVREFLKVKDHPERLKTWVNTGLGETWEEKGEAPEYQRLFERREDYPIGTVPIGALFLTAGVDVQKDRIELEVVGWGRRIESWSSTYEVLDGDTSRDEVWDKLTAALNQRYRSETGTEFAILRMAIDSGYATQQVYAWARKQGPGRVIVVKGADGASVALGGMSAVDRTQDGKRLRRGQKVWTVGTGILKSELYGWLRLDAPGDAGQYPPGYCHFPKYGEEHFKQLTAEQLVTRIVKGYPRREWQKTRERNERLDCRIYARSAAAHAGIDRFNESNWRALEDQAGVRPAQIKKTPEPSKLEPVQAAPVPVPAVVSPAPAARRRQIRVSRPTWHL